MTFARLVTHYWSNGCFIDEHSAIEHMPAIAHIPATLIHGRYDVSGPLETAWQLHRRWPSSRLIVVDDAGHGGGSFTREIVAALDEYRSPR
jgi:proline iminopeptidase